jgi:type I restriction enzyme S subunit
LIFKRARQITKKDFDATHRRTNLKPGDICMVNTGATIGRMSIAPNNPLTLKSTFQKSVAILKPRNKATKSYYLYCLLRNNIKEITELGSGTSQANLLLGDLKKYVVKYPDYERIVDFDIRVTPVFQTRNLKVEENIRLNQLKDLLLSKLATIEN